MCRGCFHQCKGDGRAVVDYKMSLAQTIFKCLYHIWSNHRLPRRMKVKLYVSVVCSTFIQGFKAWRITEGVTKTMNGFNGRCLSIITGQNFRDIASSSDFDLITTVTSRRLRFAWHIFRLDEDRLLRRPFISYLKNWSIKPTDTLLHSLDDKPL